MVYKNVNEINIPGLSTTDKSLKVGTTIFTTILANNHVRQLIFRWNVMAFYKFSKPWGLQILQQILPKITPFAVEAWIGYSVKLSRFTGITEKVNNIQTPPNNHHHQHHLVICYKTICHKSLNEIVKIWRGFIEHMCCV